MKILFIIHDLYQEDNHFPFGIGYMAAVLQQNGYEVETYCMEVYHYTTEELINFLENNEYDIIGLGFLAARYKETVKELCQVINKHKKNAWFVLGGQGPSPIPEYILKDTQSDIVAIGEAEETIIDICKAKQNKVDKIELKKIKGIAYRINNEIYINDRRKPIKNLDSLPMPAYNIFPMDKYSNCIKFIDSDFNDKTLGIVTSRGCVAKCNFCYRMEKGIRIRNIKKVVDEMLFLKEKYGIMNFITMDELFVFSKKRILEFRDELKKYNLKIRYGCNARVDLFDEEFADLLIETGCKFLNFGFESSNDKVLRLMNKNTTVEQNIKAAEIAVNKGINIGLNFIWGNPGDTLESLQGNVELIKRFNTYSQLRTIRPVTPYPGSDLYYYAIKKGLLKGPEDFFEKFKNSDLITVNFMDIPEIVAYEALFEANKELIIDHQKHTDMTIEESEHLIQSFYDLYFKGKITFRGVRHYTKK